MARSNRVTFRLSDEELADVERACRVAGVPVGAMSRVCVLNWCAFVAAEKAVGRDFGFVRRASQAPLVRRDVVDVSRCPHCAGPLREGTDGPYRVCGGCGFTESDPGFS